MRLWLTEALVDVFGVDAERHARVFVAQRIIRFAAAFLQSEPHLRAQVLDSLEGVVDQLKLVFVVSVVVFLRQHLRLRVRLAHRVNQLDELVQTQPLLRQTLCWLHDQRQLVVLEVDQVEGSPSTQDTLCLFRAFIFRLLSPSLSVLGRNSRLNLVLVGRRLLLILPVHLDDAPTVSGASASLRHRTGLLSC